MTTIPQTDRELYEALVAELRETTDPVRKLLLFGAIEEIKGKHGGMPPKED